MTVDFRCALNGVMLLFGLVPQALMAQTGPSSSSAESASEAQPAATNTADRKLILADSASPFGVQSLTEEETASVSMPKLNGPVTPADEGSFDKYYFFHRDNVDLSAAFNDISECDGYARGLSSGLRYQPTYAYNMASVAGGAIGNLMAAAIFGSAEKRRVRRVNMRACMGYKGYQRYGLPKDLWEKFNFEEGLGGVSEDKRRDLLLQQALVASRAIPTTKVLEP